MGFFNIQFVAKHQKMQGALRRQWKRLVSLTVLSFVPLVSSALVCSAKNGNERETSVL